MTYRIILCDDSPDAVEDISAMVQAWSEQTRNPVRLYPFPSAEAFLFHYAEDRSCDILLLDVEMKAVSGIDLAREIRKTDRRAEIIFITSHAEFWDAGYEVDALHYLTKPVSPEKLWTVLTKAASILAEESPSVLFACDAGTVRLKEEDILYIESSLHYLTVHTATDTYTLKESLSAFENRLSTGFFRVHRSYLASLRHITRISRTSVILRGGVELPLSRGNYDAVNRAYIEFH